MFFCHYPTVPENTHRPSDFYLNKVTKIFCMSSPNICWIIETGKQKSEATGNNAIIDLKKKTFFKIQII